MSVNNFISEYSVLSSYKRDFFLVPQQWAAYNLPDSFKWEIHPFQLDQVENIPSKPGIYSFVIQPKIASHPYCAYLMYIGKTERTLQQRFREYFSEQQDAEKGRPKLLILLNLYQEYLHFCCAPIVETERIMEIENALINAFLPPFNDRYPAAIRRVTGAF